MRQKLQFLLQWLWLWMSVIFMLKMQVGILDLIRFQCRPSIPIEQLRDAHVWYSLICIYVYICSVNPLHEIVSIICKRYEIRRKEKMPLNFASFTTKVNADCYGITINILCMCKLVLVWISTPNHIHIYTIQSQWECCWNVIPFCMNWSLPHVPHKHTHTSWL